VKGYDASAHLQMFSDHVNKNPQTDSILTYSEKHNVVIHIHKAKTNIKKYMKDISDLSELPTNSSIINHTYP